MAEYKTRLKELRNEAGLSLAKLESVIEISSSSLSQYENDIYEPDLTTLKKLAAFFDVSTDYLLRISDSRRVILDEYEDLLALYDELSPSGRDALAVLLREMRALKDDKSPAR